MKTNLVDLTIGTAQERLYQEYHKVLKTQPNGYLLGIPVAILDGVFETLRPAVKALEAFGVMFASGIQTVVNSVDNYQTAKRSYYDMIYQGDRVLKNLAYLPYCCVLAPIKIIFQAFNNVVDPKNSSSMHASLHRKSFNRKVMVY